MLGTARLRFLRRRSLLASATGLALVGLVVGGVAYAQTPTPDADGTQRTFIQRFAQRLGLSEAQVTQAATEARNEMLDEAVAAGRLTPEQADLMIQRAPDAVDRLVDGKRGGPRAGAGTFGQSGRGRSFGATPGA